ncbi:MAG TPA: hypothetical protein VKA48_08615 [Gammaproteobacteria bacterium]|nr:hypothetical protein [Gammaproteobacteria bacterium]
MSDSNGWIGVDLDRTLAHYDEWRGIGHIGEPVPVMAGRVKRWLAEGKDVRIFTARVSPPLGHKDESIVRRTIQAWCRKHLGCELPITCTKDWDMIELWDARAVSVLPNTGRVLIPAGYQA